MKKKWILPGVAAAATVIALLLTVWLLAVEPGAEPDAAAGAYAEKDGEGNIIIRRSALSADQVSFIRIAEDSNIELLARLGDDGGISVALGTCSPATALPLRITRRRETCSNATTAGSHSRSPCWMRRAAAAIHSCFPPPSCRNRRRKSG